MPTPRTDLRSDVGPETAPVLVAHVIDRARAGERLSTDEVLALVTADGADRDLLLAAASALRDEGLALAGRPGIITYSRKVFVPLTTLCRDRCHYCIFVDTPGQLLKKNKPAYMSPEQVLQVVRQGAALGCKEVLLTLGDRPEERWPEARAWLDEHGYASTLDYVAAIARLVTAETGLLAHLNPGVMHAHELSALRPVAPSMGMMLETTSRALFETPGQPHFGSPDKDPALRLQVIEDAGAARIPFTTGILVGIGETPLDRAESLVALRDAHQRHGHIQEVIVQNFRAKPRTAMQDAPDADLLEYATVVAAARLVMGARMRIQVPPNLSDPAEFALLVAAGIDDWGGVSPLTADHVNPERPWPHVDDLAAATASLGYELHERLTAHPEYLADADTWLDPAMHAPAAALADPATHLARAAVPVQGTRNAAPAGSEPQHASLEHGTAGATSTGGTSMSGVHAGTGTGGTVRKLAERAAADPLVLDDTEWQRLLEAAGSELDDLTRIADDVRRYTVGEAITIAVNRNLTPTGFRAAGAQTPAQFDLADAAAIAADAWDLGATELCIQGLIEPDEAATAYLDIVRAARAAAPAIHLHAYRPQDVHDLAARTGLTLDEALAAMRDAGVDTVPGTGVKVLSERVRGLIAPGDLEIDRWVETITAAHRAGFRSTSVLFYGHVETAAERIAHLGTLRRIQSETRGFTEFVPIPLPGPAGGVGLVTGRSALDEHRAMAAVARLFLSGSIPHLQIPWTRHGLDTSAVLLQAGGDDLGGTLLDGRVRPEAGIEAGNQLPLVNATRLARRLFRPLRQRTTVYGEPSDERKAAAR
ncbi:7,8-didemethyl-8-hydroxy-5-deazariboflavin synthase CofG subunit [Microbacterium sp. SORGH_AS428]|uniref:7,8-didemethyl-8-hydroxy-5-deazariboflavin synthase CofG n=1 Tax=Microbacterium sp. SORGH_AS_0428 TaxID=3041788 RepID=UPI002861D521|nr:7,8-didemethyl-8-hydroxy-5-deazariboflavin synthase CofG [Microbacterium sp. SORGH_AS_0428]MDR6199531.1 7,8-didemethyl-8-hydroxy-5-deazariboflavin synthase CofG subunit [Microbacterium sp. SORGH_AS_0428]